MSVTDGGMAHRPASHEDEAIKLEIRAITASRSNSSYMRPVVALLESPSGEPWATAVVLNQPETLGEASDHCESSVSSSQNNWTWLKVSGRKIRGGPLPLSPKAILKPSEVVAYWTAGGFMDTEL